MSTSEPAVIGNHPESVVESLEMSHRQLSRLFRPQDTIELRAIKQRAVRHVYCTTATFANVHHELCHLNDAGFSIYFGVLPRTSAGGTSGDDVLPGRTLCVDKDRAPAEQLLADIDAAGLPRPAVTVSSGGGGQAFWVAAEDIEPEDWVALQRGIIATVPGADATIDKKPQLMRLAGFRNRKPAYAPDFPVASIIDFQAEGEVDVASWPRGATYSTSMDEPAAIKVPDGYLSAKARAFLEKGELFPATKGGEPSRRQTAFAVACEACASNIPQDDITLRLIERLAELGLSDDELEDVERQISNAYSRERTPNVDPSDLPRVKFPDATLRHTVYAAGKGKVAVTVRQREKSFTDTIDPSKADQRRRLIRQAGQRLGATADLDQLAALLESIAAGDIVPEPAPVTSADLASAEEVEGYLLVRPERLFVCRSAEDVSGITVPVRLRSTEGIESAWRTYLRRGDQREAISLPASIEVDGITYYVSPEPTPPGKSMLDGWSKASRYQWVATGADVMPAGQLLSELTGAFSRFIEVPDEQAAAIYRLLALFSVLSYNSPAFPAVPYLAINGPAGSGKTRVLDCLKQTVFRPLSVSSTSAAAIFRQLNNRGGCLLFDEAEQLNSAEAGTTGELYPCLLAGYKRDGVAARCDGEDNEPKEFSVYGPKVLTSIRELPETLASRCISLIMHRSRRGSAKALMSPEEPKFEPTWQRLRDALHTFSINRGRQMLHLAAAESVVPPEMFPRSREIWAPLLQLAHLFEEEGVAGLLGDMQQYARSKAEIAEQLLVPDLDAAVLRAATYLNDSGAKAPTAGEIAARAHVADAGTAGNISPRLVGSILRRYGLTPRQLGGRSIYSMQPADVLDIEERYGIPLANTEKSGRLMSFIKPPIPPTPPTPAVAGDVGGVGGHPAAGGAPENEGNGKVVPGKVVI